MGNKPDRENRPAVGLVGYGSLLSPDELNGFLGDGEDPEERLVPVRVEGFRRVFNQRSVWRAEASEDNGDAVLNAVRAEDRGPSSMNAVAVPDLSSVEYESLRKREWGYRMVEVRTESLEPYRAEDELPETEIWLLPTGREERVEEGLSPIPEYVEICLEGARYWGEDFRDEFIETTELSEEEGGYALREWLDEEGPE